MNRRTLLAAVVVSVVSFLLMGCGPHWRVMSQASPDPFMNQKRFAVLPIDYAGLRIGDKGEVEYLAGKDDDSRKSFVGDKVGVNEEFAKALIGKAGELGLQVVPATGPTDAPFLIRPSIAWLEPGFYVGVASAPSRIRMTVRITTPDGRILDEIELEHATGAGITTPASGTRLRHDGEGLGTVTAEYLQSRVTPGS
jgi:hypothetical protein